MLVKNDTLWLEESQKVFLEIVGFQEAFKFASADLIDVLEGQVFEI